MGLTQNELKQLKVGNTIKTITDLSKRDSKYKNSKNRYETRLGKFLSVDEDNVYLMGYKEGEYKLKEMHVNLSHTVISRSRLTGKTSVAVNNYFNQYIKYLREKDKVEESIKRERRRVALLKEDMRKYEEEAEGEVRESNKGNIAAGDKVFDKLEELLPAYKSKIQPRDRIMGFDIYLQKKPRGGAFTIINSSYGTGGLDFKYLFLDVRYDYSTTVDGEEESYEKEVRHQWYKNAPTLTDKSISNLGKVKTIFDVTSDADKVSFYVEYHFDISSTKIDDKTIDKLAKYIADKCFVEH